MDSHHVIVRPLHTEKSVADIREDNVYHFQVHPGASKTLIRHAVEDLFPGVRVRDVRTLWVRGKSRGRAWTAGRTSDWKKAIVKLRPGDNIDIGY
jgi:large subunit ribosomal protein L23